MAKGDAFKSLIAAAAAVILCDAASAEQLRFDSAAQWRQWDDIPIGVVDLTPGGIVQPVRIDKDINPALDALQLGGGAKASSNTFQARLTIDGNPETGWAPDPDEPVEGAFLEINLGRGVSARSVTLVFDAEEEPFELFDLLLSTGEPQTDFIAAPIPGTLVYRIKERFKENSRHRVTFELEQPDLELIQFIRFEPLLAVEGARLVEVEVDGIGDNIAEGMIERGGGIDVEVNLGRTADSVPLGNSIALVDGDLYQRWRYGTASRGSEDIDAHMILDLGATYWMDQIRIIGGVVVRSGFGGGITTRHYVSRRRWDFRFYEVMTSDGSLSPDGTRIWDKHYSGISPANETTRGLVDHHFDLIPTRFVRIFWKLWDTNCFSVQLLGEDGARSETRGCGAGGTTDELLFYGTGYPKEVDFRSPLIDFGESRNLNSIEWDGDVPPGTRIEVRTRSGNDIEEQYTYRDKDGKEVSKRKWERFIPSFRGPIDTTRVAGGDWSPWSNLYAFSGEEFQSPSPRRYMEVDVNLVSDSPDVAANIDFLAINHTPPIAQEAVGEIFPAQAAPGEKTEFVYFLRPRQTGGFDRLTLEASTPMSFMSAMVNGAEVEVASQETTATGFTVILPQRVRSNQLVELHFESAVFLQGTRFDLFLGDSRSDEEVRQRVDPGDASDEIDSNSNAVSLPVTRDLLDNMEISPALITPNGDGVNDRLELSLSLINVLDPRPVRVRYYDLAGRMVYQDERAGTAGQQKFVWDGRDGSGQLVPPGLYMVEVEVEGDAGDRSRRRMVPVAY